LLSRYLNMVAAFLFFVSATVQQSAFPAYIGCGA